MYIKKEINTNFAHCGSLVIGDNLWTMLHIRSFFANNKIILFINKLYRA